MRFSLFVQKTKYIYFVWIYCYENTRWTYENIRSTIIHFPSICFSKRKKKICIAKKEMKNEKKNYKMKFFL